MDPAAPSPTPAPTPSSGLLRLLLRVDAVTSAPRFLMVLCPVLLVLGVTGAAAGLAAAGALFAAWVAVGCVGMRYQRVSGSAPTAEGRRRRRPRG
ncbi:hypothetical protein [Streptomyces sp. CC77]|uniref:hypothetical protein n=1 Tax=Streptomyces sp. CC77 TaxID=1906739 RepID=UPI0008DEA3F7|nr:hypothetical protein [Streptomyces sp. CC77]OII67025.1 hypothetical protein BJP39_07530 [Streptomyces sp. CC77]